MPHVPALTPKQMTAAVARLNTLSLPADAKQKILAMLLEAQNPNRHDVERLDAGRRDDRKAAASALRDHFNGVLSRAAAGMAALSDAEFDAMVDEANRDE